MKKYILILFYFSLWMVNAQVGINLGTESPKATLHLGKSNDINAVAAGLQLPKFKLSEINANSALYTTDLSSLLIYINDIDDTPSGKTAKVTEVGFYFFDGSIWRGFYDDKYFHLPYFVENAQSVGTGFTLDIYNDIYLKQFVKNNPTNQFLSNNTLLNQITKRIYNKNELDYIVTYYDDKVMRVNSISPDGIMNYDILDLKFTIDSFINIILVVKD